MLGGFLRKKCTLLSIQLEIINFDTLRKHYFSFLKGLPKGFAYYFLSISFSCICLRNDTLNQKTIKKNKTVKHGH